MSILAKLGRAARHPLHYTRAILRRLGRKLTRRLPLPFALRDWLGRVLPPNSGTSRMRSVYVVTYGRSGSTLLTGYLSRLPGFDLKGENFLFPIPGFEAEQRLMKARHKPYGGRDLPASPWYGSHRFNRDQWRRDFARAVLNQLYPNQVIPKTVGFKEIRWYRMVKPVDFAATLDWLRELRAPGAVIFLFRDLDKVLTSAWWAEMPPDKQANSRRKLEKFEEMSREYAAANPQAATVVTYEEFTTDPAAAERICRLLGIEFREQVWRQTLDARYSFKTEGREEN